MSTNTHLSAHKFCSVCARKKTRCICHHIQHRQTAPINLCILQDAQESQHALNTAGIILSSFINSQCCFITPQKTSYAIPMENTLVLFPSANAYTLPERRIPRVEGNDIVLPSYIQAARTLIILDATWNRIAFLYRQVPQIAQLPHITLPASTTGQYILRKAEQNFQLSTAEATAYALYHLYGQTQVLDMISALQEQMAEQIKAMGAETFRKNYQSRTGYEDYVRKIFQK